MTDLPTIPTQLLPGDGRFGCGPSKVRPEQVQAVRDAGRTLMGTSHRQSPVKRLVRDIQDGLAQLFALPDGYEVVLGVGGASHFWDVAACSLIGWRAEHVVFGEFAGKFAAVTAAAPFLAEPQLVQAPAGQAVTARAVAGVDTYAWAQNETSTGAMVPVERATGADPDALMLVDATSAAGGLPVDLTQCDAYYFSPQKCFGSDGGLWVAILSPAAVARAERLCSGDRWIPASLNLRAYLESSRKQQTPNTPALATLIMLAEQLRWLNDSGGLEWATTRTRTSSERLYAWADASACARCFVTEPANRSWVVGTVDLDPTVDAAAVSAALRTAGVVDTEPYRKLGRNQLRIGMFPSIEPDDVSALTACIDHVIGALAG